ncbi:hypothetical protein TNIN_481101 [Trichonephila inaurata madagascariensis]|uniref:Uncharacterized protein n=1 Tax=Trichonephila inaurata madagascariensis TaxID=2747483 RepID=A0A8X6XLY6_9ARAC|nr:hypothetical protein TNIN_481101 [Trichonephila inaurata madagascariensis]
MITLNSAKDEKEGLEKLKIVCEVAKKYGLSKFKKCQFLKRQSNFWVVVENGTIKPSTAKTQAVKIPRTNNNKTSQSFCKQQPVISANISKGRYSTIAKP